MDIPRYTPGVELEFLTQTGNVAHDVRSYLASREPDVLYLYGLYDYSLIAIDEFMKKNPDGKIYLKLDANVGWMNRLTFNREIIELLKRCTVVSVENKRLHEYLNRKWPITVDYIPNGYFDFAEDPEPDWDAKENTILSVGRIGTWQKASEVLLQAFEKAAVFLPNWKLKFVGTVEDSFWSKVDEVFERSPELRDRVVIVPFIRDKAVLSQEYRKAKVFCLTSRVEGFPNVLPEALRWGCFPIVSNVDCASDVTNDGNLGEIFEIDDVDGLADKLVATCRNEDRLRRLFQPIMQYAHQHLAMKQLVKQIELLLTVNAGAQRLWRE